MFIMLHLHLYKMEIIIWKPVSFKYYQKHGCWHSWSTAPTNIYKQVWKMPNKDGTDHIQEKEENMKYSFSAVH